MGNTLYLECYSGISGDMTAAALLDLGADQSVLERALKSLPIDGFDIKISRVKKAGLDACDFNVILQHDNHDHDMEYLHDNQHTETILSSKHMQQENHKHHPSYGNTDAHHLHDASSHEHASDAHNHGHHHAHHRGLADVLSIIQQADMSDAAKQTAADIFTILGQAEAKAHGTSLEDVHFHEVGAIDSIIDIISAAVCLDNLAITDVIIPVLYEGCGIIRCQHGILPVPVPAVSNIVQAHGLILHMTGTQGEFVTPTGAAIAAAVRTVSTLPEHFRILRTGLGAGKRTYERPSLLRAMLIKPVEHHPIHGQDADVIYKLETDIDDCTGEMMGYVFKCLMDAGAKDAHYFPVFMKKNRPAYQLDVLCREADIQKLEEIIFSQTTTIGIRRQRMERTILPRRVEKIQTEYGEIQVKVCSFQNGERIYPEYDSVARICTQTGKSYPEIYAAIRDICSRQHFLF